MSDNTESANEADTLSFDEGVQQTKKYANKTKTYTAELPEGGIWVFKYGMVPDVDEIISKHVSVDANTSDVDLSNMFEAQAEIFCEGIKDAPDGFPVSATKLKQQDGYVRKIVKDVADLIEEFSTADDETREKFR